MADTSIKQFPPCVPGDYLDYEFEWLLDAGDTIVSAVYSISPSGPTVTQALIDGNITTAWVSGMLASTIYTLSCKITTREGRTPTRSGFVECRAIAP